MKWSASSKRPRVRLSTRSARTVGSESTPAGRAPGEPNGARDGKRVYLASMDNYTQRIVNKAWSYAHLLRDDGLSYLSYTEQITFLLFLKMADEQAQSPYFRNPIVPPEYGWQILLDKDGDELEVHYRHVLEELGKEKGMLGEIFKKARPEVQDPAKLRRLIVDLIDQETWSPMQADVKGDIYEGLLQKSAAESPKGAGQYFTPRELIKGIVDVMRLTPDDTVCDPACGTGGFLLAAHERVLQEHGHSLDLDQKRHLRGDFARGFELVPNTGRLCVRVRRDLQPGGPSRPETHLEREDPGGPLARLRLRGSTGARQGQPGPLLAQGREPRGRRRPPRA